MPSHGTNYWQPVALAARGLGHRLIMAQPEVNGSQLEHGKEVCGVFFVARGEPTEVFDAVEEALDAVARAIEHRAEAGFPATMNHRRNVRCGIWAVMARDENHRAVPAAVRGLRESLTSRFGQERTTNVMPIGQAGERDNLRDSTRIERDSLMRTRSTDPIIASGLVPRAQAGHMNVPDPIV